MKLIFFAMIAIFVLGYYHPVISQNDYPVKDQDYKLNIETEEQTGDYTLYSFYLQNTGKEKLLFYNLRLEKENDKNDIVKFLPESIVILAPYRNSLIYKVKVYDELPNILWHTNFMRPSVGFNKYPEKNKHYVFHWKSRDNTDGTTEYTYYLKNIYDKRIRFYDLSLEDGYKEILKELPTYSVILLPDHNIEITRFTVNTDDEVLSVNWQHEFATFQANNDLFCQDLSLAMEAARDKDFISLQREGNPPEANPYAISLNMQEITEVIVDDSGELIEFTGIIGQPSTLKEIKKRYKTYYDKILYCIPNVLEEKHIKRKDNTKMVTYEGIIDSKLHYMWLEMYVFDAANDSYGLRVGVRETK
ncbi:MAG: hypothetical protein K8R53_11895 [Bacteroidales bacterium]|nr:hypothetical protein [Bacteroidales bacterium]